MWPESFQCLLEIVRSGSSVASLRSCLKSGLYHSTRGRHERTDEINQLKKASLVASVCHSYPVSDNFNVTSLSHSKKKIVMDLTTPPTPLPLYPHALIIVSKIHYCCSFCKHTDSLDTICNLIFCSAHFC